MQGRRLLRSTPILLLALAAAPGFTQAPPEVSNLRFTDPANLVWDSVSGADAYQVYRGPVSGVDGSDPARCHGFEVPTETFASPAAPESGTGFYYLLTAESVGGGEGSPGVGSGLTVRPLLGRCRTVMRNHTLNRLGFGWNEWSRDRIAVLGFDGYIIEQLDPVSIDEGSNTDLNDRLGVHDPPPDIVSLVARQMISAVYARRQLEQQVATFWTNHFNTFWVKLFELYATAYPPCVEPDPLPQCDANYPAISYLEASLAQFREMEEFRNLGFNGNFRQIVEASATSPAMILYLDTFANVAGTPNENFSRELLELYTMGVEEFTQNDVEALARVLTGWTICKKKDNLIDDPLASCLDEYWRPSPPGQWTAHFNPANHDCGPKILFLGTPQQVIVPGSCDAPADGVNDLSLALDGIALHPATARFISKKMLQRFVTDTPDQAMIDDLVAVWNDGSNPAGMGDLRAVLEAALNHPAFLDPDRTRDKIKTPLEHFAGAIRAVRGQTDGQTTVIGYLVNASHIPHYNPVPIGWPEAGESWLDTTNTLERENFGVHLTAFNDPEFGSDLMTLLSDNGVSTAPGRAEPIVDFFADVLFGGALTPADRQRAIDFLNTDNNGFESPYDETRIRRTVGFMLGYPQFQEQ